MTEQKTPLAEKAAPFEHFLGEYLPSVLRRLQRGDDTYEGLVGALAALNDGGLSRARLNQTLHRCSEAGMSEGFFRYYFLEAPLDHPYPVTKIFGVDPFDPPVDGTDISSVRHFQWGLRRFFYDAMLYWGNFRQAYRELRQLDSDAIRRLFALKRFNESRMITRGKVQEPIPIPQDDRYLISETACKTYETAPSLEQMEHVQLARKAFQTLYSEGKEITPLLLKKKAEEIAKGSGQGDLFELMYEDATAPLKTEAEVIALYAGQWGAFKIAREDALENARIYLSSCNDLDVYVATSMRNRQDFRDMASTCDRIFKAPVLERYNLRYFDPTLSAAKYHEDKGIIECLMVKKAKILLYFAQHKESLGKVSEYAMALSLGKPVIVLCPDDLRGEELYGFYMYAHPLMRLVQFTTGVVNGAMVTRSVDDVVLLIKRILSNTMEYDLERKPGTDAYYLLKERVTGTSVRVITDDRLFGPDLLE